MVKHILFFCVFVWVSTFAFGKESKLPKIRNYHPIHD